MRFDALIFDFDGVLLESEWAGNAQLAAWLTAAGHPTGVDQAMDLFMGLSGRDFHAAVERWIGRPLPDDFHDARAQEDRRALAEGLEEVAGAAAFVRSLPPELPKAICSSSSTRWIESHLANLGLEGAFGDKIFSGREHVARGKPAPDLYLHAAASLGIDIARIAIIEDSPVGVQGALASGAAVIGLVAGRHCLPGHEERLRALGVRQIARNFDEVAALLA
ncbi:MAG TPA: HAD family phosphatase [Allosphingosinicella sp.]|jgi:HAD superfamily hydrolase (TIGR01509 family)|nr:HAD family phosphatase [Allosphingosinicella sp.]